MFRVAADNVEFGTETVDVYDHYIIPVKATSKIINMRLVADNKLGLDEAKFINLRGLLIDFGASKSWISNSNIDHDEDFARNPCLDIPHTRYLTALTVVSWHGIIDPVHPESYGLSSHPEEFHLVSSPMPNLKFLTIDSHMFLSEATLNLDMMPALEEIYIAPNSNISLAAVHINECLSLDRVNAPIDFSRGGDHYHAVLPDVTHLVAWVVACTTDYYSFADLQYNITVLLTGAHRLEELDMRGVQVDRLDHQWIHWDDQEEEEKAKDIIYDRIRKIETVSFNSLRVDHEFDWWVEFGWQAKFGWLMCLAKGERSFQWRSHDVPA